MEDHIKWVTDTEVGHIELEDIRSQFEKPRLDAPYRRIKRSGLVEATIFPQSLQAPEFIMTIAQFYDTNTWKCVDDKGPIVIDLSADMLGLVFGIPSSDEVLLTTEEEAAEVWDKDTASCKRHQ